VTIFLRTGSPPSRPDGSGDDLRVGSESGNYL
jgi:hypothetical protein